MNWTLEIVFRLLSGAAEQFGAVVDQGEPELVGDRLYAEVWGEFQTVPTIERPKRDLPNAVIAARLDGIPVLFGLLDESADRADLGDALRRYRNQATIARSWLGANAQDLQLFLVGPLGSANDARWRDTALQIEADDRVCRKLVWLPTSEPTVDGALLFLSRTFLATPWRNYATPSAQRLDQMSALPLPSEWIVVITDENLTGDALVASLVEVTE